MIAYASWAMAAPLLTLFVLAWRAHRRGDGQAMDKWLALTTPPWIVATVAQIALEDALRAALCGGATAFGAGAISSYRAWRDVEQVVVSAGDADSEAPTEILKPGRDLTEAEAREIKEQWIALGDKRWQFVKVLDPHYRGGAQPVSTMPEPTSPPPGPSGVSPSEDGGR
jgi:hypothetical protein